MRIEERQSGAAARTSDQILGEIDCGYVDALFRGRDGELSCPASDVQKFCSRRNAKSIEEFEGAGFQILGKDAVVSRFPRRFEASLYRKRWPALRKG